MALPKIGLTAVLEGIPAFKKASDTYNKQVEEMKKQTDQAGKKTDPFSKVLDKFGISVDNVKDKISNLTGINREAIDGVFELTEAFGPMAVAVGAAVIGVAALTAGFVALGNRGAPLVGLAKSFDSLTASVGVSAKTLLVDLRKAANGTVSDFDLIKRANLALVGTSGQFGKEFGQKLPQVLAAARAAAKATGQDVDFLFQSLVAGIKRASPRLIDNTGIVLRLSEANAKLAKDLGKSVAQLTEEEKQIAVLNATVEAGQQLITSLGDATETNSEKLARSQATITNIFDTLAVAVQPAFGTVLDIVNRVLGAFQQLAVGIAPILGAIASIITDILGGAINTILDIISPIAEALGSFLPYIGILFQGIANVVHGVVNIIRNAVGGVVNFIKDVGSKLFGLDVKNLGKSLFEGAAAAFGSFANGILFVANQLIFPAIIGIAKFIADFLIGFSPPKKGPLSEIDKGGENIMKAWLDGIAGVSLDPVEQVAAEVSAALGDIGKAGLPVVNARLAELDKALLPFQNRLDIVKSQFDAIAEPAKAALDAIDRQMQAAQEALANGDVQAADTIRQLDAARAAIQAQLDAQQAVVDRQQIQLGLATAAQAQERALLNIRKAQLSVVQKTNAAASGALGKEPKEPKGKAGETPMPEAAGGAGIVTPESSVLDTINGNDAVNQAIMGFTGAFAGQLNTDQLNLFAENSDKLQEQFGRIGSVDLGSKLKDKFKGLTDIFDPNVAGSVADVVSRFFNPDPKTEGSFANFASGLANIDLHDIGVSVGAAIGDALIFITGDGQGTLRGTIATLTGDSSVENSIAWFFAQLPQRVSDAAAGLFDSLKTGVFDPVTDFLTGQGEGVTLTSILDTAVQFFADLPGKIITALQGFGAALYGSFAVPVIQVINTVIDSVSNAVKAFMNGIADFLIGVADGLGGIIDTSAIRNTANDIRSDAGKVNFGHIDDALPAFLQPAVPGAKRGGLFGGGLLQVGENGPELIAPASKIGVLPAELTSVIKSMGSMLAQPAPMMIPGGDTYNTSSSTFNFNGVPSDNDARRRYNALRAGMR